MSDQAILRISRSKGLPYEAMIWLLEKGWSVIPNVKMGPGEDGTGEDELESIDIWLSPREPICRLADVIATMAMMAAHPGHRVTLEEFSRAFLGVSLAEAIQGVRPTDSAQENRPAATQGSIRAD